MRNPAIFETGQKLHIWLYSLSVNPISRSPIFLVIALTMASASCTRMYANAISDRIVSDQLAMTSYRGRYTERYAKGHVVKEIQYQKPGSVRVEVVEPVERRDELVIYDGADLVMWWPRERFGVKVKGMPLPGEAAIQELVQNDTLWSFEKFHFSSMGTETLAGRTARRWQAVPKHRAPYLFPYASWMDSDYTIPLKTTVQDAPDHLFYEMAFEEIAFDVPIDPNAFAADFPEDALVVEWDLSGPGLTRQKIQSQLNFELLVPQNLPAGLKVSKILRGSPGVPMAAAVMQNGARLVTLTEMHGFGRTIDLGTGVPVQIGDETGYLSFTGNISALTWYAGDTALTLVGNLPYPEMLTVAESVTPKQESKHKGLLDIQTWRGRIIEERQGARLVREVTCEMPGRFRAEVKEPKARAGEAAIYDGETLTLWWPSERFAIRVRGGAPPTPDQILKVLKENTLWTLGHFTSAFRGVDEVAGRRADHWSQMPKVEAPGRHPTETWLDAETALPLKVAIQDREGKPWYAMTYAHIAYDEPVPETSFSLELPKDAVIFDWDLNDPHVPDAELEKALNFDLLLPQKLPRGMRIHKMIKGKSGVPMAALLMNQEGRWLSLTEARFFGHAAAFGTSLPVAVGCQNGYLDFLGAPGKTAKEMQRLMNITLLVPTELPEGISIKKIVKGRHDLPMAVILMSRGGVWLSLTENRVAGPLKRDAGISMNIGGNRGYLNFLGLYTSITWHQGNTALTLIGNLPYPELAAVASSVKKP